MSKQICNLTFEQYLQFHCEFITLMRQIGESEKNDADIIPFLKAHGQDPVFDPDDPDELDSEYYMGAGLRPWEDAINADPDLAGRKAMKLLEFQGHAVHGAARESADAVEIEGINLETYARICALLHQGDSDPATLYAENGIRDESHWTAVNAGYQAAMTTDTTGRLTTHYGELFMKYQPDHAAAVGRYVADTLGQANADLRAREAREEEVKEKVYQMASGGDPLVIARYVKEAITDAEDEEELDWYIESAADRLADENKWDALRIVLAARFETLQPGGDRDDWIQDEFDSLYDEDEDED